MDADERVTPELAAEIRALLSRGPDGARLPDPARQPVSRAMDPDDGLVSRLPAAALRPARRTLERPAHPRILPPRPTAALRSCDGELAALRLSRHLAPPHEDRRYTTLIAEQWTSRAGATNSSRIALHPWFAFLRNYVLRRRVHGRRGRLHHLAC